MGEQRLHAALAPVDILTRQEHEQVMQRSMDNFLRARFRGVDSFRFPFINLPGNGGTLNLGGTGGGSDGYVGPEQGDVWMVRRINVVSSAFTTDTARYLLFRGSTPSDPGSYNSRNIIDGQSFLAANAVTTFTQPAVPATGVAAQNQSNQAYTVVINANGATITNVSVNGITVGTAAGTYVVPAYGSISIAYTVATPTWTWTATQTATSFQIGQQVGLAYNPGSKSLLLQPGEQIFAQVYNTTSGNTYALLGEGIRVPAEMKGKILD